MPIVRVVSAILVQTWYWYHIIGNVNMNRGYT